MSPVVGSSAYKKPLVFPNESEDPIRKFDSQIMDSDYPIRIESSARGTIIENIPDEGDD